VEVPGGRWEILCACTRKHEVALIVLISLTCTIIIIRSNYAIFYFKLQLTLDKFLINLHKFIFNALGLKLNSSSQEELIDESANQKQSTTTSQEQSNNQQETTGHPGLFGYSLLHGAASNGYADLLMSLLSNDSLCIDVNGKTVDGGYTPLHLAASAGHKDCIEELLKHPKINIHVTDAFGRTPLETAEQNFRYEIAKLLQSHSKNLFVLIYYAYTYIVY